jgi:hypothetical protein
VGPRAPAFRLGSTFISRYTSFFFKNASRSLRRIGALAPQTEAATSGHHADQTMSRECLVCKTRFTSAWTGQRICDDCKKSETA